jgi:hypothetical protein
MMKVPQFDYTNFNYAAALPQIDNGGWKWNGPSQPMQQIIQAVAGLGQILPISLPASNLSWSQDFWGPALRCNDMVGNDRDRVLVNLWNSYNNSFNSPAFMSWVPWSDTDAARNSVPLENHQRDLPFIYNETKVWNDSTRSPTVVPFSRVGPPESTVATSGPASFFVAIVPEVQNFLRSDTQNFLKFETGLLLATGPGDFDYTRCDFSVVQSLDDPLHCTHFAGDAMNHVESSVILRPSHVYKGSTLLQCDLVNTSTSVEFNYTNSVQDIKISQNVTSSSPQVGGSLLFFAPFDVLNQSNSCSAFQAMDSNQIKPNPDRCFFDIDAVRSLSYQSIMDSFTRMFVGNISLQMDGTTTQTSAALRTVLANTDELAFIRDWSPAEGKGSYKFFLQSIALDSSRWVYPGLASAITEQPSGRGNIKSVLEQLFQNFTISLLSDPFFQ